MSTCSILRALVYRVFESHLRTMLPEISSCPPACLTAQSRNLVPISLENPVERGDHSLSSGHDTAPRRPFLIIMYITH